MARIEISLDEYNSLKDKIKKLEGELVEVTNDKIRLLEISDEQKDNIDFLKSLTFLDRVFRWKKLLKDI